jgi:hypothetical protein
MNRLLSLLLAAVLLLSAASAFAEEENLLEQLFTGIEEFNPEEEEQLEAPGEPESKLDGAVLLNASISLYGIEKAGITYDALGTDERSTYLPSAALVLAMMKTGNAAFQENQTQVYAGVAEAYGQWKVEVLDGVTGKALIGYWTPGQSTGELYQSLTEAAAYQKTEGFRALNYTTLDKYVKELDKAPRFDAALRVGKASFTISSDKQSIFIRKPTITGGSGSYKIAYNIYDRNGNAVNYFYSTASEVAATPGYGGVFNVFIVVTDNVTKEANTQNIGWQTINWPYASKLTVGKPSYTISSDKKSIFITRPTIKCKSGKVTIAYNIYDSYGRAVNYFYSDARRVAATPGYSGTFNVFVTVTDTSTKETSTQNIGWVTTGTTAINPTFRALLIAQTAVPGCTARPGYVQMNTDLANAIKKLNGGAYVGHITTKRDLSRSATLSAISTAFSGAKAGDMSFFFNATHGVTQNVSYTGALCTTESSTKMGYLYLSDLANALSKANPNNEVIVVLSSCGSGAAVKGEGESAQDAYLFDRLAIAAFAAADTGVTKYEDVCDENGEIIKRRELCLPKFYVLTSQDVFLSSWSWTTGRSIIGDAVIKSLTPSGSYLAADSNKDHKLSFIEWYNYVYTQCYNTTKDWNPIQRVQRYPTSTDFIVFTY